MLAWSAHLSLAPSLQQQGGFACAQRAAPRPPARPRAPDPPPPCALRAAAPGMWDDDAEDFLPAGCAHARPAGPGAAGGGRAWLHLSGDSNLRVLHRAPVPR
jgi:hypothetical protein